MTLQQIREAYLKKHNMTIPDLSISDVPEMYEQWLATNPRNVTALLDDVQGNIELGLWEIKSQQAICFFSNLPFNMDINSCRWSLEQAIINRPQGMGIRKAVWNKVDEIIHIAQEEISDN